MKRLVVCCDGTWNKLASDCPTNVILIAQAVKPIASDGTHQVVFYEEGLGTNWYDKLPGGAFGWGIDTNIKHAYRFLCLNYEPGDEIYLFGFSRGAYTVRSLGGLIHCSGLLSRSSICAADTAYEIYRIRGTEQRQQAAFAFQQKHQSQRVPITLLGCWDTVCALGLPDLVSWLPFDRMVNARYKFHDCKLSPLIQVALHAVAIDELRHIFDVTLMEQQAASQSQILRQVWFPGGHGCVGGGTAQNRGLSDSALQWMMDEVHHVGLKLEFDEARIQYKLGPQPASDFNNSPGWYGYLPNMIRWRQISSDAELHDSVKQRWLKRSDYRPQNLAAHPQITSL